MEKRHSSNCTLNNFKYLLTYIHTHRGLLNVSHASKPPKQESSFSPTEYITHAHTATTPSWVRHTAGKILHYPCLEKLFNFFFTNSKRLAEKRQRMNDEEVTLAKKPELLLSNPSLPFIWYLQSQKEGWMGRSSAVQGQGRGKHVDLKVLFIFKFY